MRGLKEKYRALWRLRFDQRIEECRIGLIALKKEIGFPLGLLEPPALEKIPSSLEPEAMVEILLLTASLARADGQLAYAARLIEFASGRLDENGIAGRFSLHFQKGIMAQIAGDHSSALEHFLASRLTGGEGWEEVAALANALFCLESLGLPLEQSWRELRKHLRRVKEAPPGVLAQVEAFELRHAFRAGDVEKVFASSPTPGSGQAFYYRIWVSELPFHSQFRKGGEGWRESFSLSDPGFHQKSYRLRTLQGLLHPDDLAHFKETEFSDRLYLWTWRALASPEEFPLERVLSLLRHVQLEEIAYRLTAEDYQMVRNSLLWLSLFDPASFQPVSRVVQSIRPPGARDFPLFEIEREVILLLHGLRDHRNREADDSALTIKTHPLWRSPVLHFARLVTGVIEKRPAGAYPLKALEAQLVSLVHDDGHEPDGRLILDLPHGRVLPPGDSDPVVSPAMATAFHLLHGKESVDCEEFLHVCFGIPRYDPEVHLAKIFNLLSRMRKVAPRGLEFHVKAGRVHATGSWQSVVFKRRQSLAGALQDSAEWRSLIRRPVTAQKKEEDAERWIRPAQVLKRLKGRSDLTREDLEELTGKSKATANRMIRRWLKQGILKKTGRAKRTRYVLTNKGVLE